MYKTAKDIIKESSIIPFTNNELIFMMESNKNITEQEFQFEFIGSPQEIIAAAQQGFIFMRIGHSLFYGILFAKLSVGRSIFRNKKLVYASYVEKVLGDDKWMTGPTFGSWSDAINLVGSIHSCHIHKCNMAAF